MQIGSILEDRQNVIESGFGCRKQNRKWETQSMIPLTTFLFQRIQPLALQQPWGFSEFLFLFYFLHDLYPSLRIRFTHTSQQHWFFYGEVQVTGRRASKEKEHAPNWMVCKLLQLVLHTPLHRWVACSYSSSELSLSGGYGWTVVPCRHYCTSQCSDASWH